MSLLDLFSNKVKSQSSFHEKVGSLSFQGSCLLLIICYVVWYGAGDGEINEEEFYRIMKKTSLF